MAWTKRPEITFKDWPQAWPQTAMDKTMNEATDEAQIMMLARQNPTDFASLYERYFPRIYRYCLRRIGNTQEAEDLTSFVFTRALAGLQSYRGGSVAAWLFRIAHNAVANHLRQRRPQISLQAETNSGLEELENLTAPGDSALDHLLKVEERQQVARMIANLNDEQRELLALRIAGGLSAKEVGAVLGKSEGAVRVALYRVMQQLRDSYQSAEGEQW